jgi:hypothetical protein
LQKLKKAPRLVINYLEAKAELMVYMHSLPKLAGGERRELERGESRHLRPKSKLKPASSNLFGMAEVAAQLGKSVRWLQEFLRDHPCGRKAGRTRIFTSSDISQLIAELPVERSSQCHSNYDHRGKVRRHTGNHPNMKTAEDIRTEFLEVIKY